MHSGLNIGQWGDFGKFWHGKPLKTPNNAECLQLQHTGRAQLRKGLARQATRGLRAPHTLWQVPKSVPPAGYFQKEDAQVAVWMHRLRG
jgi:hypothetical protein